MRSKRQPAVWRSAWACILWLVGLMTAAAVVGGDAATESQGRLLRDIKYLASDELEGRGVGLKGLDLAAEYIREQFQAAGLRLDAAKGAPFQPFTMQTGAELGPVNTLEFVGPDGAKLALELNTDYVPQSFGNAGSFTGEIVFCGYGIEASDKNYNDFAGVDLKGKVALIMRKVPQQGLAAPNFSGRDVAVHGELRSKIAHAHSRGAVAVLLVNDPHTGRSDLERSQKAVSKLAEEVAAAAEAFEAADPANPQQVAEARKKLSEQVSRYKTGKAHLPSAAPDDLLKFGYGGFSAIRDVPVYHVRRETCNRVLKAALGKTIEQIEAEIDRSFKPHSAALAGWQAGGVMTINRLEAEVKNVVGVVEGSGDLADETVIVGAHYDHVGRGGAGSRSPGSNEVHNGADDNASGTVALLELARRLAGARDANRPSRRLVFIAFTAEEVGLVGSARYTQEPLFPLEKTVAMFNLDMVGRLSENKLTVFGVQTAKQWEALLARQNEGIGLELALKPEGFGPSDHASFYSKQIPVLHFFTGTHADYHRPGDDWEKINIPGTQQIVDLVERLVLETARNPQRPEYVKVEGSAQITERPGSRPYFGSIPDLGSDKKNGLALTGVASGGPAEQGGVKAGDVIVQLGPHKIEGIDDFDLALRKFSAGETVAVVVLRGTERLTLNVTLGKPR